MHSGTPTTGPCGQDEADGVPVRSSRLGYASWTLEGLASCSYGADASWKTLQSGLKVGEGTVPTYSRTPSLRVG